MVRKNLQVVFLLMDQNVEEFKKKVLEMTKFDFDKKWPIKASDIRPVMILFQRLELERARPIRKTRARLIRAKRERMMKLIPQKSTNEFQIFFARNISTICCSIFFYN